ncbi:MAG: type I-U CRISPR-associated protein Cas5/Cas6 [Acidobacteria bacterium]|nr:type I-U CRISPR-associated protein Cas5/Cas6 [Acidobacteriota bacterium]
MLILEVEYLSGVCFAAVGPDSEEPDWPPQPDRVFSALVASWGARGDERRASLEWLEHLPPPLIVATTSEPRTAPVVFVPPNDPRSDRKKVARGVLPELRSRQPRRFPSSRPADPLVRFVWADSIPDEETLSDLQQLAQATAYVGHSTSLTRCRFRVTHDEALLAEAKPAGRRVYPGRFEELRRDFERGRRPQRGDLVRTAQPKEQRQIGVFADRWLILEHIGGEMRDLRAAALVSRVIRDAISSGYRRIGLEDRIPEVVSGHRPDKSPSQSPHLAIVPLPFAGFPHADGHVLGFALIPPADSNILDDGDFLRALREVSPIEERRGRRVLTVTTRERTPATQAFSIELSPTFEASATSLNPSLYTMPSRMFVTVTPIALDRHLKTNGAQRDEEIAKLISAACLNVGFPEPSQIIADKHSALEGIPSAYPSGNSPRWTGWRLPRSLSSRQLVHAVIRFEEPVEGPLILGAGRYFGLGLCRPLREKSS